MFNPYFSSPEQSLRPARNGGALQGLLNKLKKLDSEDILLLLLIFLLARKDSEEENLWPLAAAAIYLMLGL